MAEMRLCDACAMEYDWPDVERRGYHYCCEACANGEECTCPQHNHQYDSQQTLNAAAASQLGTSDP